MSGWRGAGERKAAGCRRPLVGEGCSRRRELISYKFILTPSPIPKVGGCEWNIPQMNYRIYWPRRNPGKARAVRLE